MVVEIIFPRRGGGSPWLGGTKRSPGGKPGGDGGTRDCTDSGIGSSSEPKHEYPCHPCSHAIIGLF